MESTLLLKNETKHKLIGVHFWDHSESKGKPDGAQDDDTRWDSPYECFVIGILVKEDDEAYYITNWVCDKSFNDWETRTDVILKCTLITPILHIGELINIRGLPIESTTL